MNPNHNSNDDQCQHPDECMKSFFTYCPHCHLYLCIDHLNQHHDTMKIDIHRIKNEAENHRVSIEQKINKIKQQQTVLNDLYDREMKILNDRYQFVTNICENNHLIISDYEEYAKQFELIKQDQRNNSFILQIDQILQEQHHHRIEPKKEISITTNILSLLGSETTTDLGSVSYIKEEVLVDSTMDCHSNELSNDHPSETDSDSFSLNADSLSQQINSTCPLSHANAFGFSINHNIPGVPCDYQSNASVFTYDRCYYHLITYHHLKQSVARLIIKTISSKENKNIDLTTLDIFTHWQSQDILSQGTTLFVAQCPLIQQNVYGLQNQPNIILCTPRRPLHLYQHLRSFHRFKPNYARRLINALIENTPLTEEIFTSNEQVTNNSIRCENRIKN